MLKHSKQNRYAVQCDSKACKEKMNNSLSEENLADTKSSSGNQLCSLLKQVQTGNDITFAEFRAVCAFISSANAFFAVLAILGNCVIIATFYRSESLRTPSNLLLLGLSFCDLFVGLVTQPLFVAETALVAANSGVACTFKDLYVIFLFLFSSASMLHVCLISVERSIAIVHPFKHHRFITKKKVLVVFLVFWISWALLTIFTRREHGGGLIGYSRMAFVIFSALVVLVINIRLWIEARRHSALIRLVENSLQSYPPSESSENTGVRGNTARDTKAAKTIVLIIGIMILCNLALIATFTARKFYNVRGRVVTLLWFAANTIVLLTSALNPVIYFWRRREFRISVRRMCGWQNAVGVQQ
ncbi:octopamine receptor beta-1R-like [Orbicella faveolata]|uniref:octopamine receptor beta-1R-like n=1 Tax=Orbicella faveolata TaxID=48498 RepID=UPI0009E31EE0|nr:octopamine receptor beta-1R-like [Orbicella faveolata]